MSLQKNRVRIIGGGLAGCESALFLADRGFKIDLHEMKSHKKTPAQHMDTMAELVCSNSFRSNNPHNAVGLLKEEMRLLGSALMRIAEEAKVPAGDALAVDRDVFSQLVDKAIRSHANITVHSEEILELPDDDIATIVATGPLTSDALSQDIVKALGAERLAFYDAIAPILDADSIDMDHAFFQSRWDKGDGKDYLNCPMDKATYDEFLKALLEADSAAKKEFEKAKHFEGCLPIEVLAGRGEQTLLFGPFKPVGLRDPRSTGRHHAVLQLRLENKLGTAYNLVGCQTRMTQGAQKEVFGKIPALKNAVFLRYGSVHRNTYLDAPRVLTETLCLKTRKNIFFAGQITGVEGYVESMACGLIVSLILSKLLGKGDVTLKDLPPENTAFFGLYAHVRALHKEPGEDYVPSNINWSLIPALKITDPKVKKLPKPLKKQKLSERGLETFRAWQKEQ